MVVWCFPFSIVIKISKCTCTNLFYTSWYLQENLVSSSPYMNKTSNSYQFLNSLRQETEQVYHSYLVNILYLYICSSRYNWEMSWWFSDEYNIAHCRVGSSPVKKSLSTSLSPSNFVKLKPKLKPQPKPKLKPKLKLKPKPKLKPKLKHKLKPQPN